MICPRDTWYCIINKNNQYDTNFIQISQKFDEVKNEINSNTKKIEDLFDVTVDLSNKITESIPEIPEPIKKPLP